MQEKEINVSRENKRVRSRLTKIPPSINREAYFFYLLQINNYWEQTYRWQEDVFNRESSRFLYHSTDSVCWVN